MSWKISWNFLNLSVDERLSSCESSGESCVYIERRCEFLAAGAKAQIRNHVAEGHREVEWLGVVGFGLGGAVGVLSFPLLAQLAHDCGEDCAVD